jgi:DNA-binding MarR family transcriptional regulator
MSAPIQETIGFLLSQVCRAHRQRAESALNALGLHVGQEMILHRLWREEGLTQTELGECAGVEAPTVTKMLGRMERAGLVVRRPDPADARLSRVYLTEHGRALEAGVCEVWHGLEACTRANLTLEEQLLLRRLLLQVRQNLA